MIIHSRTTGKQYMSPNNTNYVHYSPLHPPKRPPYNYALLRQLLHGRFK
jgi:hypothetical protein